MSEENKPVADLGAVVSFDLLLDVGRAAARRERVTDEGMEDCAIQFVAKNAGWLNKRLGEEGCCRSIGWMWECAHNFALDYRGREKRMARREAPYPMIVDNDGVARAWEPVDESAGPEAQVLSKDSCVRMNAMAAETLNDAQFQLYRRYFVEDATPGELAAELGISRKAVLMSVLRIRRALRRELDRRGLTQEDV